MFLGFQSRHAEQKAKHVEPVAPRQPGEIGHGLRNEGRGLVGVALFRSLMGSGTPTPALMRAGPPAA